MRRKVVGVIGGSLPTEDERKLAFELGGFFGGRRARW
jgi:hypothetical protein